MNLPISASEFHLIVKGLRSLADPGRHDDMPDEEWTALVKLRGRLAVEAFELELIECESCDANGVADCFECIGDDCALCDGVGRFVCNHLCCVGEGWGSR